MIPKSSVKKNGNFYMRKVMYENDEIKIDNGLFFGKGVFETILVNKKPVFLEEHVKKINSL